MSRASVRPDADEACPEPSLGERGLQLPMDRDEITGKAYDLRLMMRLWGYVRPYRAMFNWSLACLLLSSLALLVQPYLLKVAIDHYYEPWPNLFPGWREQWDIDNGRIPMISWNGENTEAIARGDFDGMISARAQAVAIALRKGLVD